jgi:hypothetical protein
MKEFILHIRKFGLLNFLFVALSLMNLIGMGHLFGYVAIALIFLNKGVFKNNLDAFFFTILLFSASYSLFYFLNPWKGIQYVVIYGVSPPFFYLWGKQLVNSASSSSKAVLMMLIFLGLLYSLPSLITVVQNISEGGFAQPDRNMPMFWGGPKVNATGMAGFLMFNMCIPALLIAGYKKLPKLFTLLLLIVFVFSFASVLRLGSRTQIGIVFLSLIISLIFVGPKLSFKQNFIIYSILFGIVALIMNSVSFTFDAEIFTSFEGRMKDSGAEDLAGGGGRVDLWAKSVEYMVKYPFGWDLEEFGYSHNLWLDALRVGGILSFVLLIILFIKVGFLLSQSIRKSRLEISLKLIFILYSVAFISVFMVEPGIDGEFSMFLFFCLFVGVIFGTSRSSAMNPDRR